MLDPNDPMRGFWDRIEDKQTAAGFLGFLLGACQIDQERYKQHAIEMGYGSEQTMTELLELANARQD